MDVLSLIDKMSENEINELLEKIYIKRKSTIHQLPDELLFEIIRHLPLNERPNAIEAFFKCDHIHKTRYSLRNNPLCTITLLFATCIQRVIDRINIISDVILYEMPKGNSYTDLYGNPLISTIVTANWTPFTRKYTSLCALIGWNDQAPHARICVKEKNIAFAIRHAFIKKVNHIRLSSYASFADFNQPNIEKLYLVNIDRRYHLLYPMPLNVSVVDLSEPLSWYPQRLDSLHSSSIHDSMMSKKILARCDI